MKYGCIPIYGAECDRFERYGYEKRGLRFPDNSFVDRTLPVNLCKISKYPGIPYCFMRILAEFDGGFSGCEG